jgi:hypothetical protein
MKTNDEIRRLNMMVAMGRAGNAARLAELVSTSPAYLSQIKNRVPDSKSGTPKAMGDELARRIEIAIGEPAGWMDAAHHDIWVAEGIVVAEPLEPANHAEEKGAHDLPQQANVVSPGRTLADASAPDETTLERLNGEEKRLLELYRRASKKGRLMIHGAAAVAPQHVETDLSLRGPK